MPKTIIEDIAAAMPDEDVELELEPVVEAPPEIEAGVDDDDMSSLVPKTHLPDDTGMSEFGGGEGEVGELEPIVGETPIVEPGETNAAPPSPTPITPSGVIKMDAPLLIKMLEHAKSGGDVHQLASHAATLCGDPSCSHLTMDHFDDLSMSAPAAEVQGSAGGMTPADFANAMPDEGGELAGEGEEVIPVEGEAEAIEGEIPGGDPVGESEVGEGGEGGVPPKEEPAAEVPADKGGESEVAAEKEDEEKEEKEEADHEPVEEQIAPIADPLIEKFQPPVRQKATENKSDVVPAKGVKGASEEGKGKGKGKPDFLKTKEEKDEDDDDSIAESVTKLVGLMSSKSKLAFKGTQSANVAEFAATPNQKMHSVLAESLTKALNNKDWLVHNGLAELTKYKRAVVVNSATMGKRHLVVLD